jgi:hypothetical protein
MATPEELLALAERARAEGREDAAALLESRASELQAPVQVETPSPVEDPTSRYQTLIQLADAAEADGRLDAAALLRQRASELQPAASQQAAEVPDQDPGFEGILQETGEGILSGGMKLLQGVTETAGIVLDLNRFAASEVLDAVSDSEFSDDVAEYFRNQIGREARLAARVLGPDVRERLGIDPRGIGVVADVITQYVAPGGLAAKLVGTAANAGRLTNLARQIGAAGIADVIVANDGTNTIGDFFEGGPTQTSEHIGQEGIDETVRQLTNKLRIGAEGAAGMAIAPFLFRGAANAVTGTATAIARAPGVAETARAITPAAIRNLPTKLRQIETQILRGEDVNPFFRALEKTAATLRYRGFLPEDIAEERLLTSAFTEGQLAQANRIAENLKQGLDDAMRGANEATQGAPNLTRETLNNDISTFLTSKNKKTRQQALNNLPEPVRASVQQMRGQIDKLSKTFLEGPMMARMRAEMPEVAQTLENEIKQNLGSYMRRRYAIFERENYTPDEETLRIGFQGFKNDRLAVETELQDILKRGAATADELKLNAEGKLLGEITDELATRARDNFLRRYALKRSGARGARMLGRVPEIRIDRGILTKTTKLRDYQRQLLGEINDPVENYMATIADMGQLVGASRYLSEVRRLAEISPALRNVFRNTADMSDAQVKELVGSGRFQILGESKAPSALPTTQLGRDVEPEDVISQWGDLDGFLVPKEIHDDMTRLVIGDMGTIGNAARSLYSTFLWTKGATQYGKTILSPSTQIRNATTASLFAAMQGNIGRGASLSESLRIVANNIKRMPDEEFARVSDELIELGLFGSQAELREMRALVKEGLGFNEAAQVGGVTVGRSLGARFMDNPVVNSLSPALRKAEKLYQGGDEIWKYYNFQFEQNKLRNALRSLPLDEQAQWLARKSPRGMPEGPITRETLDRMYKEEAARIVRNTVPNYNMAPDFIRQIRKLPVGNFIAFPYEILRTSMNTIRRGLEEMSDPNEAIRAIGRRRLIGASATAGALGPALAFMGQQLSGVSADEVDAYKRSVGAAWERNAIMIPAGRHEDGTPRLINFSYSNPYDLIPRMVEAALMEFGEGDLVGRDLDQIVWRAGSASLYELFAPFTDESIIAEKLRDVLDPETQVPGIRQLAQFAGGRGGLTQTGARIYRDVDTPETKLARSLTHILDALLPTVIPLRGSGGDLEPSRFARGFINSLGLNETMGINEQDRLGLERQLSTELARALTGVAVLDPQAQTALRYRGWEFGRNRADASSIFGGAALRPNATSETLLDAYRRANEARFRQYRDMYLVVQDARRIGLSTAEIARTLREANVPDVNELLAGVYVPLNVSTSVRQNLNRNGNLDRLPMDEIVAIRENSRNWKLSAEEVPTSDEVAAASEQIEPQPAPVAAPAPAPQPVAPAPRTSAPAPTITVPQGEVGPAPAPGLLGSNPIDALRNLEIFQRTRDQ